MKKHFPRFVPGRIKLFAKRWTSGREILCFITCSYVLKGLYHVIVNKYELHLTRGSGKNNQVYIQRKAPQNIFNTTSGVCWKNVFGLPPTNLSNFGQILDLVFENQFVRIMYNLCDLLYRFFHFRYYRV